METVYPPHRSTIRLIVVLVLLLGVSVCVSLLVSRWMMGPSADWRHDAPHGHQWLHRELGLTAEEAARIDVFEENYRMRRAEALAEFNQRIAELGELLRSSDAYTDEVHHAVHQLHIAHGKLQTLSIEHYYEMLSVLPSEKQDKLRALATEALSEPE